jgi:hypothetical protein
MVVCKENRLGVGNLEQREVRHRLYHKWVLAKTLANPPVFWVENPDLPVSLRDSVSILPFL